LTICEIEQKVTNTVRSKHVRVFMYTANYRIQHADKCN